MGEGYGGGLTRVGEFPNPSLSSLFFCASMVRSRCVYCRGVLDAGAGERLKGEPQLKVGKAEEVWWLYCASKYQVLNMDVKPGPTWLARGLKSGGAGPTSVLTVFW